MKKKKPYSILPDIMKLSIAAVKAVEAFNKVRMGCYHHTQNTLTKVHNCYEGDTKTPCHYSLCPLKEK